MARTGNIAPSSLLKCADGPEVRCGDSVQQAESNPWLDISTIGRKKKKAEAIIKEMRQVFVSLSRLDLDGDVPSPPKNIEWRRHDQRNLQ